MFEHIPVTAGDKEKDLLQYSSNTVLVHFLFAIAISIGTVVVAIATIMLHICLWLKQDS